MENWIIIFLFDTVIACGHFKCKSRIYQTIQIKTMPVLHFCLLLIFSLLPTTLPYKFTLTFHQQTLGLVLSNDLVVTGFASSASLETKENVQVGDRILAVNGQNLATTNEPLHIIRDASLPKEIEFVSNNNNKFSNLNSQTSTTTLRLLDIDRGLLDTIHILPADFGVWNCKPHLLAFINGNACAALDESIKKKLKGKIAVINRGGCSFLAKGWQVFLHGAVGAIIVNNEENVVQMPPDNEEAALGLNIPVAMVRKSTEEILRLGKRNGTYVQFYDPIICQAGNAEYATVEGALDTLQESMETIMQLELNEHADLVMEDPLYRGGRLVFAWPDGTTLRGEFLQFSSGPRTLPKRSVRLLHVEPAGGCTSLHPSSVLFTVEVNWFAVIERGHGCSFATKIRNAEKAGASGVLIANDMEFGLTYGKVGMNDPHKIPAIMIPLETARDLRRISNDQLGDGGGNGNGGDGDVVNGRMTMVIRPPVAALWSELGELEDIRGWPSGQKERRKLWKRLSIRHHPDKQSGIKERFEWLRFLYDTVASTNNNAETI